MSKKPRTLTRTLRFYRALDLESGKALGVTPAAAVEALAAKIKASDGYGHDHYGRKLLVHDVREGATHPSLAICNCRSVGFPLKVRKGKVGPLGVESDAELGEAVHLVWFANNVVGIEHNQIGPGAKAIGTYLRHKVGGVLKNVNLGRLFSPKDFERIEKLKGVSAVSIKITLSDEALKRRVEEGPLTEIGRNAAADLNGETLEIRISTDARKKDRHHLKSAPKWLRKIFSSGTQKDAGIDFDKIEVIGETEEGGRGRAFELLEAAIQARVALLALDAQSNAVKPESAYDAIVALHGQLADELKSAILLA